MAAIFPRIVGCKPPTSERTRANTNFQILKSFGSAGDGAHPSSLVQRWVRGNEGHLWVPRRAAVTIGNVLKLTPMGPGYSLLASLR